MAKSITKQTTDTITFNRINDLRPMMGCDPEFFFKYNGEIVGAEQFIPKEGIQVPLTYLALAVPNTVSKFIIDGVQAELNPRPNACRANLGNELRTCFATLQTEMAKKEGFTADFSRTVEISKHNLDQLDEAARKFGCAPSNSIYDTKAGVKVNPSKYRIRAAGGHIHIGIDNSKSLGLDRALKEDYKRTVQMLDIICGNTCVLIDRDEGNIERRKLYGKAGEYRLPSHGLEYRTLSNFWLTSYPLMSMAFGLARVAVCAMADTNHEAIYKAFTDRVKIENVHKAINKNNFNLALENFNAIESLLLEISGTTDAYPITKNNIKEFHYFIDKIQSSGLNYWFPEEPIKHWTTGEECHTSGFYDYLNNTVNKELKVALKKVA